jgi:hypothetical protein
VTEIIQHVEYSVPMARVAEIAQNATAHWGNLLTPTVTRDADVSSADCSAVRRALYTHTYTYKLASFLNHIRLAMIRHAHEKGTSKPVFIGWLQALTAECVWDWVATRVNETYCGHIILTIYIYQFFRLLSEKGGGMGNLVPQLRWP